MRLDAGGELLWLRPFEEPGDDVPVDLELTPDGVCLGWTPRVGVSGVLGQAPGLALVSFGAGSLPALGDTLWLDPAQILVIPIAVGGPSGVPGAGSASYFLGTDLTALAGLSVHVQTVFADAAGPTGKVLSNEVSVSVQ